jgi:TRAP-type mannitol/chloroaromatic compound transport system permease large subunit
MRLSHARSSGLSASSHVPSSVDCITTTSVSEFSVHTGAIPFVGLMILAVVILCFAPGIAIWFPDHIMGLGK